MLATLQLVPDPAPPVALPEPMTMLPLAEKHTREGIMWFRELRIPLSTDGKVKDLWKKHKVEWMQRGWSVRQHNGQWYLQQWLRQTAEGYTLTAIGQEKLQSVLHPGELITESEEEAQPLDLPPLPDGLEAKLFDYQVSPARQLYRALMKGANEWNYPGAWDCSDLGTGKTYQALAGAIATGLEVGVICPLSVIPAWKAAFKHFGQCPRFIQNYESLRTGNRDVVRIENFTEGGKSGRRFKWTLDSRFTVLLFDEAHNVKNPTRNQALAIAAIRQRFPLVFISGTLASDPTHMRATGRAVGLHAGAGDYLRFLGEHGCIQNGKDWDFRGGRNGRFHLTRIHRTVFPLRGARTKIADLGDRFPETQILAEAYETGETKKIAAAFKEAQEVIARLEDQGTANEGQAMMLRASAYMKAWHESERLKVPAIVEKVEEELEEGRSVAVFVNFTDVRESLMQKLKTQCAIFGGQPAHLRERCIASFQEDKARVIIANIDAGGVGVSLHDLNGEHPRTSIILPTNKVVSITQALGRVHRAGGKSRSRQIIFYAAGTLEEDICNNVRRKMANIMSLNDGDLQPQAKF